MKDLITRLRETADAADADGHAVAPLLSEAADALAVATWCACGDRIMPGAVGAYCPTCAMLCDRQIADSKTDDDRLRKLLSRVRIYLVTDPDWREGWPLHDDIDAALGGGT